MLLGQKVLLGTLFYLCKHKKFNPLRVSNLRHSASEKGTSQILSQTAGDGVTKKRITEFFSVNSSGLNRNEKLHTGFFMRSNK